MDPSDLAGPFAGSTGLNASSGLSTRTSAATAYDRESNCYILLDSEYGLFKSKNNGNLSVSAAPRPLLAEWAISEGLTKKGLKNIAKTCAKYILCGTLCHAGIVGAVCVVHSSLLGIPEGFICPSYLFETLFRILVATSNVGVVLTG